MKKDFITVSPDTGGTTQVNVVADPQFNTSVSFDDAELLRWGGGIPSDNR